MWPCTIHLLPRQFDGHDTTGWPVPDLGGPGVSGDDGADDGQAESIAGGTAGGAGLIAAPGEVLIPAEGDMAPDGLIAGDIASDDAFWEHPARTMTPATGLSDKRCVGSGGFHQ